MTGAPARVGLLGGTFNPPHLAHLLLAEAALESLALDRVEWIVARDPPHKPVADGVDGEARAALVAAAIAGQPAFALNRIELDTPGLRHSVDTLDALAARWPGTSFVWLVGLDGLADLRSWRDPDGLLDRGVLGVATRGDEPAARVATAERVRASFGRPDRFATVDMVAAAISSTGIRDRVRGGRSIRYLVPDGVRAEILARGLYADSSEGLR